MKKIFFLLLISCMLKCTSTSRLELISEDKVLGNFNIGNDSFYLQVAAINSDATSPNFIQIRRIYRDSFFEVAYNIPNRDSLVYIKVLKEQQVSIIVRGTEWKPFNTNDTIVFPLNNKWNSQRFKIIKR